MAILVDTNVLVRFRDAGSSVHQECKDVLEPAVVSTHDLCVGAQSLIEYWAVATRPAPVNGLGLTPAQTDADLADFLLLLRRLPEPPDILDRWRGLVKLHNVSGKAAHDARQVAFMLAHDITTILTLNVSDFSRYSEITILTPVGLLQRPNC